MKRLPVSTREGLARNPNDPTSSLDTELKAGSLPYLIGLLFGHVWFLVKSYATAAAWLFLALAIALKIGFFVWPSMLFMLIGLWETYTRIKEDKAQAKRWRDLHK